MKCPSFHLPLPQAIPLPLSFRQRGGSLLSGIAAALLASAGALHAASATPAPRQVSLELIKPEALVVDGKLTEPFYKKGEWQGDFVQVQNHQPAAKGSRFRLFTDGVHLFFSARVEEPSGSVVAEVTERDGPVWRDDCLELFLQPGSDLTEFLQIVVNARGVITDISYGQGGHTKSIDWNSAARAAATVDQSGWNVELAIPLADLGLDPALKEWRIQVAREHAVRESEPLAITSWAPVGSRLNDPASFGRLSLPEFDRALYGWQLATEPPVVARSEKGYTLRQKVKVANLTGKYQNIVIHSSLSSKGEGSRTIGIAPGRGMEVEAEIPLGDSPVSEGRLRHEVRLARAPESAYAFIAQEVVAQYTPARVVLVEPGYRATIFESQKLKVLTAELQQIDADLTLEGVKASFRTAAGESHAVTVEPAPEPGATPKRWQLTMPGVDLLPPGTHELTVTYTADGREQRLTRSVTKLPFKEGEVWIDRHGILHRNGKPLPVYGFVFGNWDKLEKNRIPGMFMNLAAPVWATPPFEGMAREVEMLAAQNVFSMVYIAPLLGGYAPKGKTPLTPEEKESLRQLVEHVRDLPTVIGYYSFDEPEVNGLHPERLREIYTILREADPYRPVGVLNDTQEGTRDFQYGADISLPDPYPLFARDGGALRPMDKIGNFLKQIETGQESYRARWITPQGFNYGNFNAEDNRGPTAREMRVQQIIGLIYGVVGITWYPEYMAWDEPGVYTSLPYLSQEFHTLYPLLIAGRPERINPGADWEAAISTHEGKTVLMVANLLFSERTVTLADDRLSAVGTWRKWGDANATLPGGTRELSLTLKAHEGVILVSDNVPHPESLDWAAVEQAEAAAWAASVVPGNIAHRSTGTKVTGVNTSQSVHLRPAMVQDGMKDPRSSGFEQRPFEPGMGIAFDFGKARKPARMLVIGSNVATARVEEKTASGEWKEIARLEASGVTGENYAESTLEARLPGSATTHLRLVVDRLLPDATTFQILEIELYE